MSDYVIARLEIDCQGKRQRAFTCTSPTKNKKVKIEISPTGVKYLVHKWQEKQGFKGFAYWQILEEGLEQDFGDSRKQMYEDSSVMDNWEILRNLDLENLPVKK